MERTFISPHLPVMQCLACPLYGRHIFPKQGDGNGIVRMALIQKQPLPVCRCDVPVGKGCLRVFCKQPAPQDVHERGTPESSGKLLCFKHPLMEFSSGAAGCRRMAGITYAGQVFRYRRLLRNAALASISSRFSMEERRTCSAFRTCRLPAVTAMPMFWDPVSTPMLPSWVAHSVLYHRWIVNGFLQMTEALFAFNKIRAFLVVVGIRGLPFNPITSILMADNSPLYIIQGTVPSLPHVCVSSLRQCYRASNFGSAGDPTSASVARMPVPVRAHRAAS